MTVRNGALHTQRSGGQWIKAYPTSENHFFYKTSFSHFEFVIEGGQVTGMLMYQEGSREGEKAVRVSDEVPTRRAIVVDSAILERYVGVYELQPGFDLAVSLDGGKQMAQATGQGAVQLHPETETEFFIEGIDAQVTFVVGPDGKVGELILHQGGQDVRARRKG